MKRLIPALVLLIAPAAFGQASNSVPFTAVTPPPLPTITSLSGLSASGKIYSGTKMPIIGTGYTSACVVNVDGIAQPSSTFTFVSATEIDFTVPASLGSSSGTAHALTVSCPVPVLAMNATSPATLPNGKAGSPYTANLVSLANVSGGISPYKCNLLSGSLPTGLALSQSCVLSGTPGIAGSFSFSYQIVDSSGLSQRIEIKDGAVSAGLIFYTNFLDPRLVASSRNKCLAWNGEGYTAINCTASAGIQ